MARDKKGKSMETMHDKSRLADTVNHALNMQANIRRVFWCYVVMFGLLVGNLGYFVLVEAEGAVANSFNPRMGAASDVLRGSIYDSGGVVLAYSTEDARYYPWGRSFAHVVGFDGLGRAGVENNVQLQRLGGEVLQRVDNLFLSGRPLQGNGIALTLDATVQQLAVDGLGRRRGAVVVMEPSTGRILAMASYPDHDPNNIAQNWSTLIADYDNAPLLNRATHGLYPPGSVFKVATAAAAHRHGRHDFVHYCEGYVYFDTPDGPVRIQCYNATSHGNVDMHRAFALSCNTYFARLLVEEVGVDVLQDTVADIGFSRALPFELGMAASSFVMSGDAPIGEQMQTAIGQGRTLATPLHMAMMTSAVANGGIMMRPYVFSHAISGATGRELAREMPRSVGRAFGVDEAAFLTELMVGATGVGATGAPAAIPGVAIASKTGTAEVASGAAHGWFVAFAPAETPQVAVAVIMEHSGGSAAAMSIARGIIQHVLEAAG